MQRISTILCNNKNVYWKFVILRTYVFEASFHHFIIGCLSFDSASSAVANKSVSTQKSSARPQCRSAVNQSRHIRYREIQFQGPYFPHTAQNRFLSFSWTIYWLFRRSQSIAWKFSWSCCTLSRSIIGPILDDRLKEKFLKPWKDVLCIHCVCP